MLVRRAFYGWLIPAAFLLPLWLFVGWGVFNAGGWAFLWMLFIAIPSVLIGQLVLTLLVRARGTVRAQRAVSWWDVLGFGLWHCLTIACGFYNAQWFAPVMVLTVLTGLGLFWLTLWQLWREARPSAILMRTVQGIGYIPPQTQAPAPAGADHDVVIISERNPPVS